MTVDLIARLRARLTARLFTGARLCLGLSGGLDSVVLLHLLADLRAELGFPLAAVHVHHGLSPEADAWAEFCAGLCASLDVPLHLARVRVEGTGHGLEAAARAARYAVYREQEADFIVLAHQQDDQAETLLLNLLRGAGVRGAAAMPELRPLAGSEARLLRPLLGVAREELAAWAAERGLTWVEDASNQDPVFARNFLRHAVLPVMERRFPACRDTLSRAARHFAESGVLLDDLADLDARHAVDTEGLRVAALAGLSRARAKNLLRRFLSLNRVLPMPAARMEELLDQLTEIGPDQRLDMKMGERHLRLWQGRLRLLDEEASLPAEPVQWRGEAELSFAGGMLRFEPAQGRGLSLAKLSVATIVVDLRRPGGQLQPDCRRPRRSLKKLFQEGAIPPWERAGLPMLYADGLLVWVAGLGADCAWQAAPGEPGVLIVWSR